MTATPQIRRCVCGKLTPLVGILLIGMCHLPLFAADWPMSGRDTTRNAVSDEKHPPLRWVVGDFDRKAMQWNDEKAKNIKWHARLGNFTFGSPIVANGQVYIGTNGSGGHVKSDPYTLRHGYLLCFRADDGKFLWRYVAKDLDGYVWHYSNRGLGSSPLVQGNRLWFVSNRWEVLCLDTQGFHDKDNDGPYKDEPAKTSSDADVVWKYDLRKQLKVHPFSHIYWNPNRQCSPVAYGNRLYVVTGNGARQRSSNIPSPKAPSLVCFDKTTGKVLWTDSSPSERILRGQFGDPTVVEINGKAQVIVGQGDGWIRSFDALTGTLIWKFDINPKVSKWEATRDTHATRNSIMAAPVFYKGRIYLGSGRIAESTGPGRLVCIDPTKTGDISSELAVDAKGQVLPDRRFQAVKSENGEKAIPNPNSGLIWEFTAADHNKNGKEDYGDAFQCTMSNVVVKNDLLIAVDSSGFVHCFHASTGIRFWVCDLWAEVGGSPLIVGDWVYVPAEDYEMAIFRLSDDPKIAMKKVKGELSPYAKIEMKDRVSNSPAFANGVLYIATGSNLWAIARD